MAEVAWEDQIPGEQLRRPPAVSEEFDDARQHRYNYDSEDHQGKVSLHHGYVAEVIPGEDEYADPSDARYYIVKGEPPVRHGPNARDKRGKGTNDRDEPRDDDRFPPCFS